MKVRLWLLLIFGGALGAVACQHTPPPKPSPSPTVAVAAPSPTPKPSPSLSPEDPPWQKKRDEGIQDFLHNDYRAAVNALLESHRLNDQDPNAVFWLYRSYEKLETTHNQHSDSYVYALMVVKMAPGTSQAKAAYDYISSVDSGTMAKAPPGESRATDVGELFSGYTTCRMSLVDLDGKRYAGLQFTHERKPDTNNVVLTPKQWIKFATLFGQALKKWNSVQDKRVTIGSIEEITISVENKSGTTIMELDVKDDTAKQSNTLVMDTMQAKKFQTLMDKVTQELSPMLPAGSAPVTPTSTPSESPAAPASSSPAPAAATTSPAAAASPSAAAASPTAAAASPAAASPGKK